MQFLRQEFHVPAERLAHAKEQVRSPQQSGVRGPAGPCGHGAGEGERFPDHQVRLPVPGVVDEFVHHRVVVGLRVEGRGEQGVGALERQVVVAALPREVDVAVETGEFGAEMAYEVVVDVVGAHGHGGQAGPGDGPGQRRLAGHPDLVPRRTQRPRQRHRAVEVCFDGERRHQNAHGACPSRGWVFMATSLRRRPGTGRCPA